MEEFINKIINGDCLEVMKEIPDESVDLVLTDPPYGINYQSARRIDSERFDKLEGDNKIDTAFIESVFRLLKKDGAFYMFSRWDVYPKWLEKIKSVGFIIKNCIIWDRIVHGLGDLNGSYAPTYDMIFFAIKKTHILKNGRPKDIIRIKRVDADKLIHPTQKPIELIEKIILNSSVKGDLVLDPFLGSGTTAVAALKLQRRFIGIEIHPEYVKMAEARIKPLLEQRRLI